MVFLNYVLFTLATLTFLFCALDTLLGIGIFSQNFIVRYVPKSKQLAFRSIIGAGYLLMAVSTALYLFSPLFERDIRVYANSVFAVGALILAITYIVFIVRKRSHHTGGQT